VSPAVAGLIAMGLTGGCAGSTTATLVPPTDEPDAIAAESCDPMESFEDAGNEHVADGTEVDDYNSQPPTSGPHYATPADPGLYSSALPEEQLVHNLEHGQIVIYFSPAIPEEMIVELQELVASDPVGLLAVPYAAAASPSEVILTAWTHLQRCDGISVEDIDEFRSEFQGRGPENVGVPAFNSGDTA
jgi:Protein of unknown function (DUF3105)